MTSRPTDLDEALALLAEALDIFHGEHELCDEVASPEWIWRWRTLYLLDAAKPDGATMTPGDIVMYHGNREPRPAQLVRYRSDRKAVIRLAGAERSVWIRSLREIGGDQ